MSSKKKPKKPVTATNNFELIELEPRTPKQELVFDAWDEDKHLILHGTAGTGKTFLALGLALDDLLASLYKRIIIVRSVVPSRDMGFLPGDEKTKAEVYEAPYDALFTELFNRADAYMVLKTKKAVEFRTSSFLRGMTFNDCIIIVDECQNCSDQELHTIMTRVGQNCKIIFCGDTKQDDLTNERRKEFSGFSKFLRIIGKLSQFAIIQFGIKDIQRSDIVRDYIIEREKYEAS